MRFTLRSFLPISALLLACGGGSDTTAPNTSGCGLAAPKGTMTATVNGVAFTAGFIAQATIQNSTPNGFNALQVNGVSCPASGSFVGRQILFTIGRGTPFTTGTYQLDAASQLQPPQSGYTGIGTVSLSPNLWYSNLSDATGPGSGSITFTTITATRLVGTFQMVAVPVSSNESSAKQRVTITNGAFDVSVP
jgi:hypothetical protein